MWEEEIIVGRREQRRAWVLNRVLGGQWTGGDAAMALGLSIRQVRRLKGAYEREGIGALVHGNRGRRLLTGAFGGQSDTVLSATRSTIADATDVFPVKGLSARLAGLNRPLNLTPEQADAVLDAKYGQSHTFMILATLYPWLDYQNLFHQDHIFPRSLFTKTRLQNAGVPADDIEFCLDNVDRLPNLQLLAGTPNQEKSNRPFDEWLAATYPSEGERANLSEDPLDPRRGAAGPGELSRILHAPS